MAKFETPKFLCWTPDDGETDSDGEEVEAIGPAEAAEEYAEAYDHATCSFPDSRKVRVRDAKGKEMTFDVQAESYRRYDANEED